MSSAHLVLWSSGFLDPLTFCSVRQMASMVKSDPWLTVSFDMKIPAAYPCAITAVKSILGLLASYSHSLPQLGASQAKQKLKPKKHLSPISRSLCLSLSLSISGEGDWSSGPLEGA